jgi:hypothetical protein
VRARDELLAAIDREQALILDEVEALVAAARTSGLARLRWKILVPIY